MAGISDKSQSFSSSFVRDAMGVPMQVATKFVCEDGTAGTTVKSPTTVSSTEIDLTVPPNAVVFVVRASGADLRVAITNAGTAAAPYEVVKDGERVSFPVAKMDTLHLLRDSTTDVTASWHFELVA